MYLKKNNYFISCRFDDIDGNLLENQNELLTNISAKVELETSQVWRQIGIMYQELSAARASLDKLQEYSEIYVNATTISVEGIEKQIGSITNRIEEMYSNLNYLLGRLSLVNQEFNGIKTGLGDAIENLKLSFKVVQDKVKTIRPGPGPHTLPPDEHTATKRDLFGRKFSTTKLSNN